MMKEGKDLMKGASVVILAADRDQAGSVESGLRKQKFAQVDVETNSLSMMNGAARALIDRHDIILFDVPAMNAETELAAAKGLISTRDRDAVAIALASEDLTLSEVRRIRESGFDEVLPRTTSEDALHEVIEETYRRKIEVAAASSDQTKIIAVTRARGGLGATTLAVNLARQLVQKGNRRRSKPAVRVALLDLDVQFGDANVLLDVEDEGNFAAFLAAGSTHQAPEFVTHSSGIDILCAPKEMIPLDALTREKMTSFLDSLKGRYDYVIVDLPRALVDWVSPVLEATSQLLVVTNTSVQSIRQARRLRDVFCEDNITLPITYVANRASTPLLRNAQITDAEKVLETRLTHWIPDMPKEVGKAADLGCPVVEHASRCKVSRSIAKLAVEVAEKGRKSPQKTRGQFHV